MIKLGITGGIGSGKSTICKVFAHLGVPVFNADDEAKKIVEGDSEVISRIKEAFGENIYNEKGLDRPKIAAIVFGNKEALKKLNSIVHPALGSVFQKWVNIHKDFPYVVKEAAILFESGAYKEMDKIATIVAPEELRIYRVVNRDKISSVQVKKRIENQMADEEKIKRSNFVIFNDDNQLVLPQILKIHQELSVEK